MKAVTVGGALAACVLGVGLLVAPTAQAAPVCGLGFMPTKPMVGVGSIIATAKVTCDVPPERHELRLSLDIFVRGEGWQTQKMDSFDQIPHPTEVYQTKTACMPGTWRIQAEAVGSLNGKPFDYATNSMEAFVTAEQCRRGRN